MRQDAEVRRRVHQWPHPRGGCKRRRAKRREPGASASECGRGVECGWGHARLCAVQLSECREPPELGRDLAAESLGIEDPAAVA
jgi:hypothetical protein